MVVLNSVLDASHPLQAPERLASDKIASLLVTPQGYTLQFDVMLGADGVRRARMLSALLPGLGARGNDIDVLLPLPLSISLYSDAAASDGIIQAPIAHSTGMLPRMQTLVRTFGRPC